MREDNVVLVVVGFRTYFMIITTRIFNGSEAKNEENREQPCYLLR